MNFFSRSLFRALSHRNFRLFFTGQFISLIGTWMQSIAQAWLVYRLSGSATMLGSVAFASQIPVFLISPFGGALADQYDKRRILLITQLSAMAFASCLALLTLTQTIEIWHIFVLASCLGVVNGFDIPTRQSFVVEMVGKADLINAIGLNSSMFNAARIIGPSVAGVLISLVGEGWCFFLNAVSYTAVIWGLLLIRTSRHVRSENRLSALQRIREGAGYAWSNTPIRALLMLLGLVSLCGMPYAVLMPVFADEILNSGANGLGILMGASGAGAVTGALFLASRTGIAGLGRVLTFACLGFGSSLILFSMSETFWLSVVLLVPVGATMMAQMASTNTLLQVMVPDQLRGRIMSLYAMMFMGMAPLGSLFAGIAGERLGAPTAVATGGILIIFGGIVFTLRLPVLSEHARELIRSGQMGGGEPQTELRDTTVHS